MRPADPGVDGGPHAGSVDLLVRVPPLRGHREVVVGVAGRGVDLSVVVHPHPPVGGRAKLPLQLLLQGGLAGQNVDPAVVPA